MKSRLLKLLIIPLVISLLVISSCNIKSSYFQKEVPIPDAKWSSKFMPDFKLEITDTTAKYGCFLLLRHDEAYPNSNLWVRMKTKEPGQNVWQDGPRLEVVLADAEGKWLGRGMGGIWEHKIWINSKDAPHFTKPGIYEIKLEQLMRLDPLPSVLNVGLIIEKMGD